MSNNLKEYFAKNRYNPTYLIGDRIRGTYQGIPISGTVGNDTLINEEIGPIIVVHLDLPIRIEKKVKYILIAKHEDVKILK